MMARVTERRRTPRDTIWYRDQRLTSAVAMELAGLESRILCCVDHNGHNEPSPAIWPGWTPYTGDPAAVYQQAGPLIAFPFVPLMSNPLSSLPALSTGRAQQREPNAVAMASESRR